MEDQNTSSIELLHNIKIVLVGTTHPGNIGASARAMKNMGLSNLILVEPKDFPNDQAIFRSKAAKDVVENATVFSSVKEAVSECDLVIGTSARERTVPWPIVNPREASIEVAKNLFNQKIAIVFGREDRGITNEELGLCNLHVTYPLILIIHL